MNSFGIPLKNLEKQGFTQRNSYQSQQFLLFQFQVQYESGIQSNFGLIAKLNLINIVSANIDRRRFDQKREIQLLNLIVKLFSGGISSIEIFLRYSPRDLLDKGFTLREAYTLIRELGGQCKYDFPRPSNKEIEDLSYDQDIKQLALFKVPFIQPIAGQKYKYVLILGPQKTGKTSFLFNLINIYYDVDVDSLYRVKKQSKNKGGLFYDEYLVEMKKQDHLIFVDFIGMGDLEKDIFQDSKINFFQVLLEYVQDKEIIAAFFVNSASINRLGQEEVYTIQRFFELFHKSFSNRIFLILTFCTDNNPLLSVYSHNNSPTPKILKNQMNQYQSQIEQKQMPNEELKFWFGINNNYLYFPALDLDQESENILINHRNINFQDFKQNCSSVEVGIDLTQSYIESENFILQENEIEVTQRQILQFYYEIMRKELLKIQSKINNIFNSQNQDKDQQLNHFKKLLKMEMDMHSLGVQPQLDKQQKPNKNLITSTNYIAFENQYEKKVLKATTGKKILFCTDCQKICHYDCELDSKSDLAEAKKMCQNILINFKFLSQMKNPTRINKESSLDILYYCKMCSQRDMVNQSNNKSGLSCLISKHILINEVAFDVNNDIYYISNEQVQQTFKQDYDYLKKQKQLYAMNQTLNLNRQIEFLQKVKSIKHQVAELNDSQEGLISINLQVRKDLLEKTQRAGIQIKSPNFEGIQNVYNNVCHSQKQQIIKGNNRILFQLYKLVQKEVDE
ncbi:unnamed protein product (macronuclear) [Paramecium tetraurelia]|uniref:G domain-containing protein n=1 Tax=Paramecium tetraurelia TaxID=5888 RepID=A0CIK0_PARTE|nr:uncharacterized protein GSPATT00007752001 [Paramecium tetraurelia]CAK70617.1 unnamed protein product [Paramecium tetraurelia]|eukprot:XP_001438014.1 hypothetical protein (macronuclear) [Paramecium tetraurelia strain d4-2]